MNWPQPFAPQPISSEDPEVKRDVTANVIISGSEDATTKLIHHFLGWTKLKTSVAWFLRLKNIFLELRRKRKELVASFASLPTYSVEEEMRKARDAGKGQLFSLSDFSRAESAIIGFSQRVAFMEEITSLRSGGSGIKKQ